MLNVMDIYRDVAGLSPDQLRQRFREVSWDDVEGPPDLWFNLATHYSQWDLDVEARLLYTRASQLHPNSVDLLCGLLQLLYNVYGSMDEAAAIWQRLQEIEDRKRYWRYWAFGAIYHAKIGKPDLARQLLDEAPSYVPARDLAALYKADVGLRAALTGEAMAKRAASDMAALWKGIEQGIPFAHTLALELSNLIQRQAHGLKGVERRDVLLEALKAVDMALSIYVDVQGQSNHPFEEVLFHRARLLVCLERYGQALPLLRTVEQSTRLTYNAWWNAVRPFRVLCEQMLGEYGQDGTDALGRYASTASPANVPELARLAQSHPGFGQALLYTAALLQGGE